jgi:hypothetical protein
MEVMETDACLLAVHRHTAYHMELQGMNLLSEIVAHAD